jgi:DNA primase
MSGRIPQHFIDDLLARADIVDLIDRHVPLKKTGTNYSARCPFHTEKTPSFSVNRNKQFYYCFGCGASGNAVGFLMAFSHLDYVEAIEDLARFVGVEVPRETAASFGATNKSVAIDQYQLLQKSAEFYAAILGNRPEGLQALDYLEKRGINRKTCELFLLGYAPDEWRTLTSRFNQSGLLETGMLIANEGNIYDRFRGRLMFPIRDKRGRVIAFGGRVLDDSLPKYLNSPETSLFHKGKEVYGLYELLQHNAKPARILVVEGYMDVVALANHGIRYAVATLGTATSQTHMDLLFRFTKELVFCFDGDSAGQKAAWRAISSVFPALKEGREIRVMLLPENHDPDSLVATEGKSRFEDRISQAEPLSDYFFSHVAKDLKLTELEHRSRLKDEVESLLKLLPVGSFRELMFAELSRLTKLHIADHEAVLAYNRKIKKQRQKTEKLSIPSFIMALLIQNPHLIGVIEQQAINWEELEFEGIAKFKVILDYLLQKKPTHHGLVLEHFRGHADETIIKKLARYNLEEQDNQEKVLTDSLNRLLLQAKTAMLDKLILKSRDTGLTDTEKEMLRNLTTVRQNSEKT